MVVGGTAISGGRGTLAGTPCRHPVAGDDQFHAHFFQRARGVESGTAGVDHSRSGRFGRAGESAGDRMTTRQSSSLQQLILLGLLIFEVLIFSVVGNNFFTAANLLQIVRVSTELGLVALAMTTVITTGGIDLSGRFHAGIGPRWFSASSGRITISPWPVAAGVCLMVGCLAGALNAVTITRLRIHPLIVTLATFFALPRCCQRYCGTRWKLHQFPFEFCLAGKPSARRYPGAVADFGLGQHRILPAAAPLGGGAIVVRHWVRARGARAMPAFRCAGARRSATSCQGRWHRWRR